MFERRLALSYRGSVSFRHQPPLSQPTLGLLSSSNPIIVGRSFGPFLRSASLQQQSQFTGTGLPSVNDEDYADGNKCESLTSNDEKTQPSPVTPVDIQDTENGTDNLQTRSGGDKATKTEQIDARQYRVDGYTTAAAMRTTRQARAAPSAAAVAVGAQYKFLRRQFSMDQKQLSFQIKPSVTATSKSVSLINSGRWRDRRIRYESAEVISRRCSIVGDGITKLIEEAEAINSVSPVDIKPDLHCDKESEDTVNQNSDTG